MAAVWPLQTPGVQLSKLIESGFLSGYLNVFNHRGKSGKGEGIAKSMLYIVVLYLAKFLYVLVSFR
jgi:hypothetical protein